MLDLAEAFKKYLEINLNVSMGHPIFKWKQHGRIIL